MNRLVERQIQKYLTNISSEEREWLTPFFQAVSDAYDSAEADRSLMERSIEISSREMQAKNHELEVEAESSREAIASLRQTLSTLEPRMLQDGAIPDTTGEEVIRLSNYLRSLVAENQRKQSEVDQHRQNVDRLTSELQRFKIAVDSAGDFIMILDSELKIIYANAAIRAQTGYIAPEGKTVESQWWSHVDPEVIAKMRRDMTLSEHGQNQYIYELEGNTVTGDVFPVQVQGTTVRDESGAFQFILIIARDVTKERKADQLKDEFVSIASHELRTPMTVIRGYADILLREKYGPLTEDQKKYLSKIVHSTQGLIGLVGDILSISKLEANKATIALSPQSSATLVGDAYDQFKEMYEEKGVHLTVDQGDAFDVMADPERIAQIMNNLLSNAFKFTPKDGTVIISSRLYAKDQNFVVFSVRDSGIGIPPEGLTMLFKKFSQVDNVLQRQVGGTGLGLAICKEIIEKLGGRIWAESEPGNGSAFYFTLPLVSDAKPAVS